jgi:ribosome maturation factor RimP
MDQTTPQKTSTGIDLERVRASIGPVLSARGVSLVEAEWVTDRAGWILRLTIEHEGSLEDSGGVTLEDCVDISRGVSEVLDAEDFIGPAYNLEVSSPGLDRPLRTEGEFARFKGRLARVKLTRPAPDGQRLLRGTLLEAPAGVIAVLVDGKRIEAPFGDVAEANLVFELGTQPKKGQPTKGQRAPGGKRSKSETSDKSETSGGKRAARAKTGLPAGKSS